jgi:hypothetical protein
MTGYRHGRLSSERRSCVAGSMCGDHIRDPSGWLLVEIKRVTPDAIGHRTRLSAAHWNTSRLDVMTPRFGGPRQRCGDGHVCWRR